MWPIKKKSQVSATEANLLSWIGEGGFLEKIYIRGWKPNRKFYKG